MPRPAPKHSKTLIYAALAVTIALAIAYSYSRPIAPAPAAAPQPPVTAPVAPPPQQPTAAPAPLDKKAETILELFSPSDPYLTKQLNETALSQQIEQIITTSFVLRKCNIITDADYRNNLPALILHAQYTKFAPDAATADAKIRLIAESARTSYTMVYGDTQCSSPKLPIIAKQLLNWQNAYLSKQP